jgi:two-component system response regulator AtoC
VAPSNGMILLVDDDPAVGKMLSMQMVQAGFLAEHATSGDAALKALGEKPFDVVITDLQMPGMSGLDLLERVTERWPEIPVVLLTAHGTVPTAVEAMRKGAADFMLKPWDLDELLFVVNKAMARTRNPVPETTPSAFVGSSGAMREVHDLIKRAAAGTATVLVRGESGTGKELAARAIHDQSPRRAGPFVKLHCAALPETLLESELFGYEKGAFTGAASRKPGRVELAQGGTLFLDEIGDITPAVQVKLLRVLQEKEFERLGGTQTLKADVRFVAATHRKLEDMVKEGQFREDLFYRLNVVPIWVPPLRQRPEDIAPLAEHFCKTLGGANGKPNVRLTPDAMELLRAEPWPGNVRQLQNFIERLVVLSDGEELGAGDVRRELERQAVPAEVSMAPAAPAAPGADPQSLDSKRKEAERAAIVSALQRAGDNRTLAARLLGVSRRTLYNKLEEHGLL